MDGQTETHDNSYHRRQQLCCSASKTKREKNRLSKSRYPWQNLTKFWPKKNFDGEFIFLHVARRTSLTRATAVFTNLLRRGIFGSWNRLNLHEESLLLTLSPNAEIAIRVCSMIETAKRLSCYSNLRPPLGARFWVGRLLSAKLLKNF